MSRWLSGLRGIVLGCRRWKISCLQDRLTWAALGNNGGGHVVPSSFFRCGCARVHAYVSLPACRLTECVCTTFPMSLPLYSSTAGAVL